MTERAVEETPRSLPEQATRRAVSRPSSLFRRERRHEEGMGYLETVSSRTVTMYIPLAIFLFVLLAPFYWMGLLTFKTEAELHAQSSWGILWVFEPTLDNIYRLLFRTEFPMWVWNTVVVTIASTFVSIFAAVCAAYAIERLRYKGSRHIGMAIFLAYLVPPPILFIPLATMVFELGVFNTRWALILTYPTILVPFATWLMMGYFRSIPYELEECALIDGANRFQILAKIVLPLSVPGLISAGIFAFTLSWNEYLYALVFISSSYMKTVPVGVVTELIQGDVYDWGALMGGALLGSLPVVILYSFFVEHYVSSMTGAIKE